MVILTYCFCDRTIGKAGYCPTIGITQETSVKATHFYEELRAKLKRTDEWQTYQDPRAVPHDERFEV